MTLFPGGENPAVPLLDETVEPVCEKNVELSGIFCIHGKVDVAFGGGDRKRTLDGIFHEIPQDYAEIHVGDCQGSGQIRFTMERDLLPGCDIAVIGQNRVGRKVRTVAEAGGFRVAHLLIVDRPDIGGDAHIPSAPPGP